MFADRGYAAVTTRQIAQRARVTMPSIYRYFGDKRSLYLAACSDVLRTFGSIYSAQLRAPGAPDRKILTFVTHLYGHWRNIACFAKIVMREIIERDEKGLDQLTRRAFMDHFFALTGICRKLGAAGGAQPQAFSIYATGFGYLQLSAVGRSAGIGGLRWRDPQSMARVVLAQVLPDINWAGQGLGGVGGTSCRLTSMRRKSAATDSGESVADRILEVATRMFADRGYGSVTTREIAHKARVTFPTMYRRFPSKRELYLAACGAVLERAGSKYLRQVRQGGSAEARLLMFVTEIYHDLLTDPCISKLVMREILDQDEKGLQHLTRNFFAPQYREVRDICRKLTDSEDVDRVAFSIYAVAFGYAQLSPIGRTMSISGTRWKKSESMARMILNLILPAIDWSKVSPLAEARAG